MSQTSPEPASQPDPGPSSTSGPVAPSPVAPSSVAPLSVAEASELAGAVLDEVERAVVGKRRPLTFVLAAILAKGHVLLEDFPGLGKTLAARSLARVLGLEFSRVQFTPDLLPADVTGSFLYNQRDGSFEFRRGPLFTGLMLADEINRTPPKTQSALLEAMQERQVTVEGETFLLPEPFHVLATANPIEYEGTYPLPEAQLDRFLFKHVLKYPSAEEERVIVATHGTRTGHPDPAELGLSPVIDGAGLAEAALAVSAIRLNDAVIDYVVALVRATRETADLEGGASPRAAAMLATAARARAALEGRDYVIPDDVKALAPPVLRHRVILSSAAEIEGRHAEGVVTSLIEQVEAPR
jgi:MoxR-like ATPase